MKKIISEYGAYLFAIVLFVVLAYTYCKPVLSGKKILAADNITGTCAVYEALNHDSSEGEYGFWNGSMFSGMPNYQIGGGHYKSADLLNPLLNFFHRGHAEGQTAWVFIIYFICFFILLRSFNINKWLCIVGAIAIALSSYFIVIIAAGHNGKTSTIALMSVVMAGFYLTFRKKYVVGALFTMLFTAVGFSTHPQMSYYIFMMIGLLFCAELFIHIKEKRIKELLIATCIFACSLMIGLGTGASNIFANNEYAEQTMRGGHSDLTNDDNASEKKSKGLDIEYATQWSYGIDETMSFMIPGFMGGSNNHPVGANSNLYKVLMKNGVGGKNAKDFCSAVPMYWGDQPFTSGNVYMGAIICFLFLLGLLIVEGPYKWALLAATIFSTALAWGHNCMWLTEFFFKYFPLYSKFRAVSSILIVAEIAMPLLGFMALAKILDGKVEKEKLTKSLYISGGITAGLCLIFALFGGAMFDFKSANDAQFVSQIPDWLYAGIVDERRALLKSDSWRSFLFIAATFIILWIFAKGKMKGKWVIAILGVLIIADMWPVDKRYLNDSYFQTPQKNSTVFEKLPYEEALLQDPDPHFRVMNCTTNTFNESRTSCYLKSIGGYSAAKLRRYQDLIDKHLSTFHFPVIGMLNTKYLITDDGNGNAVPQYNPYALGNAWFVGSIEIADNANEEIDALNVIDLKTTAVVDKSFANYISDFNPGIDPDAKIALTKYQPRYIDYVCSSSIPGTVIFSEIYYPYGWKAMIDGNPVDHFRANYTLRAMNVPAGTHNIHFEFDPDSVKKGDAIATACIIIMYVFALSAIVLAIWRKIKYAKN